VKEKVIVKSQITRNSLFGDYENLIAQLDRVPWKLPHLPLDGARIG